ncbi:hypothetical protein EUX98_g3448 [Antrodiella citrinella]|uniref:CAP-Gly domain-containing protein n=1 Tax=Antrodiella citrinella TaxID=2447956 RepID=A0A4S4MWI8_9APHY|nr:hypothetical protein EUX98_g3448 [Antrodiella citrinella]
MIRSPQIGARISHGWDIGTVRFIGTVEGSLGDWLGIEWDDPRRGKHDGVKGDKRYFSCMTPNAGSFLRPTVAGLIHGTSFLKALSSKYVEALHASAQTEKVTLGSSNGAIEVEAVNLDKVRARLSQLDMLREVSLDNQGVALPDPLGRIKETCPGEPFVPISGLIVVFVVGSVGTIYTTVVAVVTNVAMLCILPHWPDH